VNTPAAKRIVKAIPVVAATPAAKQAALAKTTVITASRGRSWLSVRTGGPNGLVLFQGVLEQGKTLHFTLQHSNLWVRMGRPWNVHIALGGHRVNGLPAQAGNVLLTRNGPQAA
jgi:hypothetical protein